MSKSTKNAALIALLFYVLCLFWVVILKCNLRSAIIDSRIFMSKMTLLERVIYSVGRFAKSNTPDILVNIIIFLPIGLLFPFIIKNNTYFLSAISGTAISLAVELAQLLIPIGCFTYIDIFSNSLGAFIGVMVHYLLRNVTEERMQVLALRVSSAVATMTVIFATVKTIQNIDIYL
jgi:glycopeptide antibiotics resistance protein